MIRLEFKREPYWLDLGHGVRVFVKPCTTAVIMAARSTIIGEAGTSGERGALLVRALARLAIEQWEGVGDAEGNPIVVSDVSVDALMDLWPIAEAFERLYFGPALLLDAEKTYRDPRAVALRRRGRLLRWVPGAGATLLEGRGERRWRALPVSRKRAAERYRLAGLGRPHPLRWPASLGPRRGCWSRSWRRAQRGRRRWL